MKTNAARILDGLGIRYQLREYQVDEEDLSAGSVARKVGLPAEQAIELFDVISVSSGTRGTQLLLSPADYLRATKAKLGPIARSP
jgi:Cys-tRNA(Pro)/Cys-tRNA(Cys) deacylase